MLFDPSSKDRLTDHDLGRFPDDTLFHRLARVVCHAACLPRKELFEAWETAKRVRRVCRGGRVVDLGGGHGLLAHAMLLLDDSSPEAIVVDTAIPPSGARLHDEPVTLGPRLSWRVTFVSGVESRMWRSIRMTQLYLCMRADVSVMWSSNVLRQRVLASPCCHAVMTSM